MPIVKCKICGNDIEARTLKKTTCFSCRTERVRIYSLEYYGTHKRNVKKTIPAEN